MARRKPTTTHGVAVVDKPPGVTSHDVVGTLRRRFGERQVGHAGTLDPDAPGGSVPPQGWDHSVNPVAFSYAATEFEVALPITSINRAPSFPMRFYVADYHRPGLEGFITRYANRVSSRELEAIRNRYPSLGAYLEADRFFVQLDRIFVPQDPMAEPITMRRSGDDSEVVPRWPFGGAALPLALLVVVWGGRRVRRRRTPDVRMQAGRTA